MQHFYRKLDSKSCTQVLFAFNRILPREFHKLLAKL